MANAGSYNTLWNLFGKLAFALPREAQWATLGPAFNFVGVRTVDLLPPNTPGYWVEVLPR